MLFLVKLELEKRPTLFELHFPAKKLEVSKSMVFQTEANERTSDIPRLVDFIDGYLILAVEQRIYYANIDSLGITTHY